MFWFFTTFTTTTKKKRVVDRRRKTIAKHKHTLFHTLWMDCMKFSIKSSVKRRVSHLFYVLPLFFMYALFIIFPNDPNDVIRVHSFKLIRIVTSETEETYIEK